MFGTFTGSSKRPRKVDLSGQRRDNPFNGSSWSPSGQPGPSKSVEDANKQREERQRQRDRLRATLRLQKVWRGQQARNSLRKTRRLALDAVYSDDSMLEPRERLLRAVPLILALFQASHPADVSRLTVVAQDLLDTKFSCFQSKAIHPTRLKKLTSILVTALEMYVVSGEAPGERSRLAVNQYFRRVEPSQADTPFETLVTTLDEIIWHEPQWAEQDLERLYKALAKHSRRTDMQPHLLDIVRRLAVAPLVTAQATGTAADILYLFCIFPYVR